MLTKISVFVNVRTGEVMRSVSCKMPAVVSVQLGGGQGSDDKEKKRGGDERRSLVTAGGEGGQDTMEINQQAPRVWPPPGERGDGRGQ